MKFFSVVIYMDRERRLKPSMIAIFSFRFFFPLVRFPLMVLQTDGENEKIKTMCYRKWSFHIFVEKMYNFPTANPKSIMKEN